MKPEELRARCINLLIKADDGHCGSVMSLVEIVCDVCKTLDLRKDKLIISKGHGGMVIYPILHEAGMITDKELSDFRKPGALLTMFPHKGIPGIPASCGSLGNGIGYACGMAMANRGIRVVCIMSEGELYEGSIWEALMFANHYNLTNLLIIIDKNDAITLGKPEDCLAIPWGALLSPFIKIVQTVKGKGVPEWEGKIESHYWIRPQQTHQFVESHPAGEY